MEITICDPYFYNEKLILDHEITCKELKEKISSQLGRDTTNSIIFYDHEPLNDHKIIQLNSSMPFIIVDKNVEKPKSPIDYNNSYYPTARFEKNQHYKMAERTAQRFAVVFGRSHDSGPNSDSSEDDEGPEDEDQFLFIANDNNISDANNENTDEQEENNDLYLRNDNTDSELEMSNNSSSENEDTENDTENNSQINQAPPLLLYSQNNNNQNRENQNTPYHRFGDVAILQPFQSFNVLVHPFHPGGSIQSLQRRPQQQESTQATSHLIDFFSMQDSDEAIYDDQGGNDNDDDDENENGNENDNNGLQIDLTPEEKETVRRICLENDRFDSLTILQVFEACGRDAETTVQCLHTM